VLFSQTGAPYSDAAYTSAIFAVLRIVAFVLHSFFDISVLGLLMFLVYTLPF